mgnify:CR=1 FL=1
MANNNTLTIPKGEPFKIRWNFKTKDVDTGETVHVNRTCTVVFTGVTLPSENGKSYELENQNNKTCTDLTADEISAMYVTTSKEDSFDIQLPA